MPQSSFSGWSAPKIATGELGWSASCARSSLWIAGLGIDCTFTISTSSGSLENHRKSGHKKPGLNIGSAGIRITAVPGLFSELFNVAASRPAQMTTEWVKTKPPWAFRQDEHWVNKDDPLLVRRRTCAVSNHEGERANPSR